MPPRRADPVDKRADPVGKRADPVGKPVGLLCALNPSDKPEAKNITFRWTPGMKFGIPRRYRNSDTERFINQPLSDYYVELFFDNGTLKFRSTTGEIRAKMPRDENFDIYRVALSVRCGMTVSIHESFKSGPEFTNCVRVVEVICETVAEEPVMEEAPAVGAGGMDVDESPPPPPPQPPPPPPPKKKPERRAATEARCKPVQMEKVDEESESGSGSGIGDSSSSEEEDNTPPKKKGASAKPRPPPTKNTPSAKDTSDPKKPRAQRKLKIHPVGEPATYGRRAPRRLRPIPALAVAPGPPPALPPPPPPPTTEPGQILLMLTRTIRNMDRDATIIMKNASKHLREWNKQPKEDKPLIFFENPVSHRGKKKECDEVLALSKQSIASVDALVDSQGDLRKLDEKARLAALLEAAYVLPDRMLFSDLIHGLSSVFFEHECPAGTGLADRNEIRKSVEACRAQLWAAHEHYERLHELRTRMGIEEGSMVSMSEFIEVFNPDDGCDVADATKRISELRMYIARLFEYNKRTKQEKEGAVKTVAFLQGKLNESNAKLNTLQHSLQREITKAGIAISDAENVTKVREPIVQMQAAHAAHEQGMAKKKHAEADKMCTVTCMTLRDVNARFLDVWNVFKLIPICEPASLLLLEATKKDYARLSAAIEFYTRPSFSQMILYEPPKKPAVEEAEEHEPDALRIDEGGQEENAAAVPAPPQSRTWAAAAAAPPRRQDTGVLYPLPAEVEAAIRDQIAAAGAAKEAAVGAGVGQTMDCARKPYVAALLEEDYQSSDVFSGFLQAGDDVSVWLGTQLEWSDGTKDPNSTGS
jgi:hypothetical protein